MKIRYPTEKSLNYILSEKQQMLHIKSFSIAFITLSTINGPWLALKKQCSAVWLFTDHKSMKAAVRRKNHVQIVQSWALLSNKKVSLWTCLKCFMSESKSSLLCDVLLKWLKKKSKHEIQVKKTNNIPTYYVLKYLSDRKFFVSSVICTCKAAL